MNVLLVDDNPSLREAYATALKTAGHTVVESDNCNQAMTLFKLKQGVQFNAVIVDWDLGIDAPNGGELVKSIQRRDINYGITKYIIISSMQRPVPSGCVYRDKDNIASVVNTLPKPEPKPEKPTPEKLKPTTSTGEE